MDHHCFFINNCVGIKNIKFFILFLIYTEIYCVLTDILIIAAFCKYLNNFKLRILMATANILMVLFVFICGIGFAYFVIGFLLDINDSI